MNTSNSKCLASGGVGLGGVGRNLRTLLVCLLLVSGATAEEYSFYSNGQARAMDRSDHELLIETTDGGEGQLAGALVGAGYTSLRRIDWLPACVNLRLVTSTDTKRPAVNHLAGQAGVGKAWPVYRDRTTGELILINDRICAKFRPGTSRTEILDLCDRHQVDYVRPVQGLADWHVLTVRSGDEYDAVRRAADIYFDKLVECCHPDYRVRQFTHQAIPDDPFFNLQWHLDNDGSEGGTFGADIDVMGAWAITLGNGAAIAVLDDAVNWSHEDLVGNFKVGKDIISGDADANPEFGPFENLPPDEFGEAHGTCVAGLAVAAANDLGVRGVAPEAQLIPIRFLNGPAIEEAESFTWSADNGADVISNSWGSAFPPSDLLMNAINNAAIQGRGGKGCIIMFSAGNESGQISQNNPIAGLESTIAVGASLRDDRVACYSNFGIELAFLAPGGGFPGDNDCFTFDMVTTDVTGQFDFPTAGYNPSLFFSPNLEDYNYHDQFNGTSAACPVAAGVAALTISANPNLTRQQVRNTLEHTCDRVHADEANYDTLTSHSAQYGFGRLNARRAVEAAQDAINNGGFTFPSQVRNIDILVSVSEATLSWTNGTETESVLVTQSESPISFIPQHGQNLIVGDVLGDGSEVVMNEMADELAAARIGTGQNYFGVFALNQIGNYSHGVGIDTQGNVRAAGPQGTVGPGNPSGSTPSPFGPEEPLVSVRATPSAGKPPLLVTFTGNALVDSPIVSAVWDFGDGNSAPQRIVDHLYEAAGSYVAVCTVTDTEGDQGSASVMIDVSAASAQPVAPPSATINAECISSATRCADNRVPLTFRLTADTFNFLGNTISFVWDLGDGTQATGQTVEHTYQFGGTFSVALNLSDELGSQAMALTTITVLPGSTDPPDNNGEPNGPPNTGRCGAATTATQAAMLLMIVGAIVSRRIR